jgi:hypothetical protein
MPKQDTGADKGLPPDPNQTGQTKGAEAVTGKEDKNTGASPATGNGIEFEDDDLEQQLEKEEDPRLKGILQAMIAERQKRQAAEQRLRELEALGGGINGSEQTETEPTPDSTEINWDELFGTATGDQTQAVEPTQAQAQQAQVQQPQAPIEQINDWLRDNFEDNPLGALAYTYSMFRNQEEQLMGQARRVVPDLDKLPVHEVRPEYVQMVAQNPVLLRAIIAKSINARGRGLQEQPATTGTQPQPSQPSQPPLSDYERVKQQLIEEGRRLERERMRQAAEGAGMAGEGPSATATTGEVYELDEAAKQFYLKRGYKPEQFPELARQLYQTSQEERLRHVLGG